MPLIFYSLAALIVAGLAMVCVKYWCDRAIGPHEVTKGELVVGFLLMLVVGPVTTVVGEKVAINNVVTFNEYWNGWEAATRVESTICHRDGACMHHYSCDPYRVPYSCGTSENPRTCYRTEYHQCPYVRTEYANVVDTTLGPVTIDRGRFPENPDANRWRASRSVPASVVREAGVGNHPFWISAKQRIDASNPWPVTKVNRYTNYILPSSRTILKRYSGLANQYEELKLLPTIGGGVYEDFFYRAQKAYQVGCPEGDHAVWNDAVERLNGALGGELHGDLRLVMVCKEITNPDNYRFALEAYWQDTKRFAKNALPKNTIVVIVGTSDMKTVAWARAFTGMPLGNESLVTAVQTRFRGANVAWTPEAIVGTITPTISEGAKKGEYVATSSKSGGILPDVFWGVSEPATKFARVSMGAEDDKDGVGSGFEFLLQDVELEVIHLTLIALAVFVTTFLSFALYAFRDRVAEFLAALFEAATRR